MKIASFDEFAALPEGAIFSFYEPRICEGLYRKGATISFDGGPKDFFYGCLVAQCWNGEPPTVDDIQSRWGAFDYEQQFAIYEPDDIACLVRMLTEPHSTSGSKP